MSSTDELIDYTLRLKFEDLTDQAIEYIKIHILDTMGATIAGSVSEGSMKLVKLVKEWGGREESSIIVYGGRVPSPNAALLNSVMSRGFDFETILFGGATHVSASIIPATLAIAEYSQNVRKRKVSGRDLITAIALGTDLNWRFRVAGGASTIMAGGWLAETFAPPAIAALGGKLLCFEREKINYAMSIGYNQCCGTYGTTVGEKGGLMAQLSQGLGAKTGVSSVLFAERGFTAYKDVIDGRWGLYSMYGDGSYDADILTGELGKRFEPLKPGIKKFPGCGAIQPVASSTLTLMKENHLRAEDIDAVQITVGEASYKLCGENKWDPENPADALWNYRYSAATALVKGKVFVDDYNEGAIRDPGVLKLIPKIEIIPDASMGHGVKVVIQTMGGESYKKVMDDMEPASKEEILDKFKKCCRFSAKLFSYEKAEKFIDVVDKLEEVQDITEIMDILV